MIVGENNYNRDIIQGQTDGINESIFQQQIRIETARTFKKSCEDLLISYKGKPDEREAQFFITQEILQQENFINEQEAIKAYFESAVNCINALDSVPKTTNKSFTYS